KFFIFRCFHRVYGAVLKGYLKIVGTFLKRPVVAILLYLALCLVAFWGFVKWPTSYVPQEDMGYFMTSIQLPTGAALDRTEKIVDDITAEIKEIPEVADVMSISGMSFMAGGNGSNLGSLFVVLKPWDERRGKDQSVDAVIRKVDEISAKYQEAIIFSLNPPAIPGLGLTSGLQMQLLDINNLGSKQLATAIAQIQEAVKNDDRIASVTSLFEGEVPQYSINIDRDKVESHNLNISDVYSTLSAYMGGSYVNDFVEFGRVYQVNLGAQAHARGHINDVLNLSVKNSNGDMVPFSAFCTTPSTMGDPSISRYNMYTTASVTATPAKDVSTSEAIAAMEEIVNDAVGTNYSYAWTGEAYQETQSGTTVTIVLLFAVVITILVLAAQYESWTDPLAVVLSMPTAILGTVIGCIIMSQSISIYTQIGIILLLGLSAKNAILIVEYAVDYRKSGLDIRQSALNAGNVRFRPIMMTALAFVFGVMPMLFATGAGAASRISLGAAVVFGMAVNAITGTLFVPNFWEMLERFREKYLAKIFKTDQPGPIDPPSDSTSASV
ncbi:MAG: efflux RND transporter permease subunit, partial [Muribaculaceae bacterium]|nr:efflux RND transporter permease subunit [Muribaculaceae bacterium]